MENVTWDLAQRITYGRMSLSNFCNLILDTPLCGRPLSQTLTQVEVWQSRSCGLAWHKYVTTEPLFSLEGTTIISSRQEYTFQTLRQKMFDWINKDLGKPLYMRYIERFGIEPGDQAKELADGDVWAVVVDKCQATNNVPVADHDVLACEFKVSVYLAQSSTKQ